MTLELIVAGDGSTWTLRNHANGTAITCTGDEGEVAALMLAAEFGRDAEEEVGEDDGIELDEDTIYIRPGANDARAHAAAEVLTSQESHMEWVRKNVGTEEGSRVAAYHLLPEWTGLEIVRVDGRYWVYDLHENALVEIEEPEHNAGEHDKPVCH